ncbi:unnamed protein product [Albugo candida]|nr:unnamed protein product [Albugo candida]|eukprot:CCI48333.1 unnamed protein product [Albugo candida]
MVEEFSEMANVLENSLSTLDGEITEIKDFEAHYNTLKELLSPFMEKLRILETHKQYYEKAILLDKESHKLQKITKTISDESFGALEEFQCLLRDLPMEFAYLRSVGEQRLKNIENDMQKSSIQNLKAVLNEAGWPTCMRDKVITDHDSNTSQYGSKIRTAFGHALRIQYMDKWTERSELKNVQSVLAINCLLKPVLSRFHYHFTLEESVVNRLFRPEWSFKYVLEQIEQHQPFLNDFIQPALDTYAHLIPCSEARILFIRELIIACKVKLDKDVALLNTGDPAVFCHTVDEIMMFERNLDENYDYGKWSALDRSYFIYCTDALTDSSRALFTWTKLDREFAIKALTEPNDNMCQLKCKDYFDLEKYGRWLSGGIFFTVDFLPAEKESICVDFVPPLASKLMVLLEFFCRRIVHMKNEELRYLYVTQVHYGLLDKYHTICNSDHYALELGKHFKSGKHLEGTWACWCGIMRGVMFVIQNLTQWEQSVIFIELTQSLADSKLSRTRIMKKYLETSKTAISMAARVASETVLTRDEATAVREAIVGPGALIGPTAAFSAAYSIGFETVKTLFGTSPERKERKRLDSSSAASTHEMSSTTKPQHEELERVNVLDDMYGDDAFAQSIFERYISHFEKFILDSIETAVDEVAKILRNDLYKYQQSSFWATPMSSPQSVSNEITASLSLCQILLSIGKQHLPPELSERFSKFLARVVDDSLSRCIVEVCKNFMQLSVQKGPGSPSRCGRNENAFKPNACAGVISKESAKQFELDVEGWLSVWTTTISEPTRVFRRTCAARKLLLMDRNKLKDIENILATEAGIITSIKTGKHNDMKIEQEELTQITTILEASGIASLTPQEVYSLCHVCV